MIVFITSTYWLEEKLTIKGAYIMQLKKPTAPFLHGDKLPWYPGGSFMKSGLAV